MSEIFYLSNVLNVWLLPALAATTLAVAKLTHGPAARLAEQQFLTTLIVMTVITLRTVIICDEAWLVHMSTLGLMIVGALVLPNQEAAVAAWRGSSVVE